jgi:putative transposase
MSRVRYMEVTKGRGYVYSLRYHIVFCTKYRHKIITGPFEIWLKEAFQNIAKSNGFKIVTMEVMPDHVHLLVDCTPQHYIPSIIKALKGNSARFAFKEFPGIKKSSGEAIFGTLPTLCAVSAILRNR